MYGLYLDKTLPLSMTKQLTNQIRQQILQDKLKGGEKLPPTRSLAKELNIARNTVIQVYEQLIAEGYLESRAGSYTYVADLGDWGLRSKVQKPDRIGYEKQREQIDEDIIRFHAGNPDISVFPRIKWAKLLKDVCLEAGDDVFGYKSPAGEWELRSALSKYLFRTKDIECHPEQILIVPGATMGVDLLAKVFKGDINEVAVEDPSLSYMKNTFRENGYLIHPVFVDDKGMRIAELYEKENIRLIYVVPSHQFPLGSVMTIGRRLQLLDYARENDAYIIEDDYDSEFKFQGEPIQSLRHLDPDRVIYLGTFSKIFSPGLRLGYIIVPDALAERVKAFMEQMNIRTSPVEQLTMARFIESKLLDQHIYKMKKIYENKRKFLINSMQLAFGERVRITGENAGLHILVTFADYEFNQAVFQRLLKSRVEIDWVEDYSIRKGSHRSQLVLGYGNLSLEQITIGIERLKNVIEEQ